MKRKTEAEMDGLREPRHAIGTRYDTFHDGTGWRIIVLQLNGSSQKKF